MGSCRERQGNAAALKAGSAKHPCVHEIRVSTSDSCCWVATVKQIMSAGGSSENSAAAAAADHGHAEVSAGCVFCLINCEETFYGIKFKGSHFAPPPKKRMKIYFEQSILELQTVIFKLSNGSRCCKKGVMVLGNGMIIVIQDKDAYCHWQGV